MSKPHSFTKLYQVRISKSLESALLERSQRTGESIDHIMQMALAAELKVKQHTLFQISTSTALVEGVYQGCISIAELKKQGDFGLGTFDSLDGEGIMFQGEVWQAKSDGQVLRVTEHGLSPFWVMTHFQADLKRTLKDIHSWDALCQHIDQVRKSENIFFAIHLSGFFQSLDYRVACKTKAGIDLVSATQNQAMFHLEHCEGDLIGFWSPAYAKTLNVPGYHLHFLSKDKQHAGHVLALKASQLTLELSEQNHLNLALPESQAFLQADLRADPSAALAKAEQGK